MADFYSNLAAVASRLLTKYGQSVTFSRTTGAILDPVTGSFSGGSTSTYTGYGAAFDYNSSEIDGEIIQSGDIRFMLEQTSTTPAIGDEVTIDSTAYRVMSVKTSSPGGTVTHYELQLRV